MNGTMNGAAARLPLLVLAGPTGVGKTAAAVSLCEELGGEIVGADSVQVYRGLDAGSSKPSPVELCGIPHHLLDVLDPDEPIDAAAFAARADVAIADVRARGRIPVVVGGTGLWLRALLRGLVAVPPVDRELRALIEREAERLGPEVLHARLARIDPRTADRVHANDRVRIVRALEVHAQTGLPLGELRAAHALGAPRYRALVVVLDVDQTHWRARVDARVPEMLAKGWIDEVRGLVARYGPELRALRSVGYREVLSHVVDGAPREELDRAIARATRRYGRRQRTWFRTDPDVGLRLTPAELAEPSTRSRIRAHFR